MRTINGYELEELETHMWYDYFEDKTIIESNIPKHIAPLLKDPNFKKDKVLHNNKSVVKIKGHYEGDTLCL